MQVRVLLFALVALTAYATPIVAPNPKSVKLIPKTDNVENLKDNFEVLRLKRAASDSGEEDGVPRMEEMKNLMSMMENVLNSDRVSKAKNMGGMMSDMIKLVLQFLKFAQNYMNANNVDSE